MSAVLVADASAFIGAPTSEAPLVQSFIDAAEGLIAEKIGSPIAPTAVVEKHQGAPTILLDYMWVVAGSVAVADSTGAAVTYELRPGGLIEGRGYGLLTVSYTAGFDPLPAALRLAILYTVQHAYESQQGAVVVNQGGADESFIVSRGFALPNRAKEYLEPYLRGASVA